MILPHTQLELAMVIAERVRSRVASTYMDPVGYIQISIGIAVSVDGSLGEEALERADQALYRAKQQGRNRCEVA